MLRTTDYGVDFYGDILFTSESEVERDPERVAAFVRASLRGWEYAFAHPEELADRILELPGARERGLTRDLLLAEAREMHRLALPEPGDPRPHEPGPLAAYRAAPRAAGARARGGRSPRFSSTPILP